MESDIRIHALIRPRFGDFCYTDHEFEIIRNEVRMFRKLGAEGVVIGILCPDGTLNMEEMEKLMEDAGDMSVTLHRASTSAGTLTRPSSRRSAWEFPQSLTSGQKNSCVAGKELLRELVAMEKGEITVQIGSGVDAAAIRELQPYTGAHAFHMTGKVVLESSMQYRQGRRQYGTAVLKRVWRSSALMRRRSVKQEKYWKNCRRRKHVFREK